MVHTFKYDYDDTTTYYFIYDVESGSISSVDYIAYLCAKKNYNNDFVGTEDADYKQLAQKDIEEVNGEFAELEEEGNLNTEALITTFKKDTRWVKALCLHICHDCNLRCIYCFAKDGSYNTPRDYMTLEVGKKSIDFILANSGPRTNLEVDFFGGEPLMNFQVVKDIVAYAKIEAEKLGKKFLFTMTTNCVLLNKDTREFLEEEMDNVVLSIDGRAKVHNAVRKTISGVPCYDLIKNNALEMRKLRGDKRYYARGTFTANNLDFGKDILELNDMGFDQISIEPVVLPAEDPLAITEEHLPKILVEYDKFAKEYLKRRHDGSGRWFNFFHFMIDLDHGPCVTKRLTGCGCGTEYLAVTPVGDIYPCHQFVGKEEFKMGTVFDGIEREDMREQFSNINVLNKKHCKECFAKFYCGGGCTANAYNFTNDLNGQYKIACEMTKKRLELSLAIACIEKMRENY
ncbi:MAG: thioether cross-link-forming SCIFF peptide maturase [Clostridia bacterium]